MNQKRAVSSYYLLEKWRLMPEETTKRVKIDDSREVGWDE